MMQKEKIEHKDDMTVALPSDKEVLITRTLHAPRTDHAFSGIIREFRPPERVVRTNNYENIPGAESLETMTLEEHGPTTKVTIRVLFKSREQRDGYVASGAEGGIRESYQRLDEHLAKT
jgi:uncharacterized protein YndB with AHSA1/START domain